MGLAVLSTAVSLVQTVLDSTATGWPGKQGLSSPVALFTHLPSKKLPSWVKYKYRTSIYKLSLVG